MNADTLIGSLVHALNGRMMNFPEPAGDLVLPPPRPGASYLLYLHVPFCEVLCPFCSFHRLHFERGRAESYFASLLREIEQASDAGYRFDELYVGGGTPTVMPAELLETIGAVRQRHPLGTVSVETNPDHLDEPRLGLLREAGVNRLSVGVQSFDDGLLAEMGRLEKYGSGEEIASRLERHRGAVETINVDMIFNQPHQTEASLQRDLDILTGRIGVDQVSFYPLMADASVRRAIRKHMGPVEHDREKGFYQLIAEHMRRAGYTRNSAWCFSRRAADFDEYIVRREEYLGLGSGAFSYLGGAIFAASFSLSEYRELVAERGTAIVRARSLARHDQMRYYMLVTLFSGKLDKRAAEQRFDGAFGRTLWFELAGLRAIRAIRDVGDAWELTESGQYLWVVLMREFFTGINRLRDQLRPPSAGQQAGSRPGDGPEAGQGDLPPGKAARSEQAIARFARGDIGR